MGNIFGKAKPLKEILRENKRNITRAIRELDRERAGLEREEKKLIADIKKQAKEGQMKSVKIMAKDLVRTRQYITKFIEMRSHLQGAAIKLQTVKSHQAMAESMGSVAKAMVKMNKQVDIPAINKMMQEFAKENEKSELMQEVSMMASIDGWQMQRVESSRVESSRGDCVCVCVCVCVSRTACEACTACLLFLLPQTSKTKAKNKNMNAQSNLACSNKNAIEQRR